MLPVFSNDFRATWLRQLFLLLAGIPALLLGSCFRRFQLSESELEQYFACHPPRPVSHFRDLGKHRIHWVETGTDSLPLLVFIHGAPGAWHGYLNLLTDSTLKTNFTLISVDRPGYNLSAKGGKVLSLERQADLISAVFRDRPGRAVYLLGRSYGAPIAALLAARFPEQVKGLVLLAPAMDPAQERFWWFSPVVQYPPLRWLFPQPVRRASSEKYAHRRELLNLRDCLGDVRCPTQILHGGEDWIVWPRNACYTDSVLIGAPRLQRFLPGTGHLISRENPRLVVKVLLDLKAGRLY